MPFVPPSELTDIKERAQRRALLKLMMERSVLGYTFSYERLFKTLKKALPTFNDQALNSLIEGCVVAYTDEQSKKVKAELNDSIAAIFTENGVKTLRDTDPFGNRIDYIYMESEGIPSTSTSKMKEKAPTFGIDTDVITKLIEACTTRTPFVTVQARRVKEDSEDAKKAKA